MWIAGLAVLVTAAILYWLIILSEGVYLGKRAVIALYDWGASSYDRVKRVQPHDDAQHLARPLLRALGPNAGTLSPKGLGSQPAPTPLVLDVATGTGRLPLALLRQWDFSGRVVGVDLSRRMLSVAGQRIASQRQRVGLIRQNALALAFPEGRFDAVTCVEAMEFFPNPWSALREMVRVVRPGGHLLISNRAGHDALFFPGRVCPTPVMEDRLRALGLVSVSVRRWQVHYDLIEARRPEEVPGQEG
jgi:ubiquinone/menaquinone biosynthesis C-methylase UbiE